MKALPAGNGKNRLSTSILSRKMEVALPKFQKSLNRLRLSKARFHPPFFANPISRLVRGEGVEFPHRKIDQHQREDAFPGEEPIEAM